METRTVSSDLQIGNKIKVPNSYFWLHKYLLLQCNEILWAHQYSSLTVPKLTGLMGKDVSKIFLSF